jgi:hypothetical protein
MNGLLNRLLATGPSLEWNPSAYPPFNAWVYGGTVATSAILLGAALFLPWRRTHASAQTDIMIMMLSITLASPIAWEHHYGILLPVFAYAAAAGARWSPLGSWTLVALGSVYFVCSNYFGVANVPVAGSLGTLAQSYLFLGALTMLLYLYRLRSVQGGEGAGQAGAYSRHPVGSPAG